MGKVLNVYFSSVSTTEKHMKTRELEKVNGGILRTICFTVDEVLNVRRCVRGENHSGLISNIQGHCGKLETKLQAFLLRYMTHRQG